MRHLFSRITLAALILCGSSPAWALSVTRFSPEGMMARVTRVLADFDMPAVPLGDGSAADPFLIECGDGAVRGAGRRYGQPILAYCLGLTLDAALCFEGVA